MPLLAWAAIGLVAAFALTAVTMKAPPKIKPATLDDFDVPQFEEGTPQAVVFGDVWLDGWFVLWYGNCRSSKIKAKTSGKGK